jgi:hypothetical protein
VALAYLFRLTDSLSQLIPPAMNIAQLETFCLSQMDATAVLKFGTRLELGWSVYEKPQILSPIFGVWQLKLSLSYDPRRDFLLYKIGHALKLKTIIVRYYAGDPILFIALNVAKADFVNFGEDGQAQAKIELATTTGGFKVTTNVSLSGKAPVSTSDTSLCRWSQVSASPTFTCTVRITTGITHPLPIALVPVAHPGGAPISEILRRLVDGEDVTNTRFLLFSQRYRHTHSDGQVSIGARRPRDVYANSDILSSLSEYFQNCTSR